MSFPNTLSTIAKGSALMGGHAVMSPFSRTSRIKFLEACREHFGVYLKTPNLKQVEASDVVDSSLPINLEQYIRGRWQVTMVELTVIASLVKGRSPKHVFEIGTFDGRTTLNMAINLEGVEMHTIDLPMGTPGAPEGKLPGQLIRDRIERGEIKQLFGNTLEFDFSPWYGTQDLVFVDAGHGYVNALADTKTALKLVQGREGMVVWHDYAVMPGVTQAVEEIMSSVESDVDFCWVKGTSLAMMIPKAGSPVKLSGELAASQPAAKEAVAAS